MEQARFGLQGRRTDDTHSIPISIERSKVCIGKPQLAARMPVEQFHSPHESVAFFLGW